MSLYDDIDGVPLKENNSAETAGWSNSFSFMQQQLKRQKVAHAKSGSQLKPSRPAPVLERGGLIKQPELRKDAPSNDENKEPQSISEPFLQTEASVAVVVDEYDPMKPNDYEDCKKKQREKDKQERELERTKHDKDYDERYRDRDRDRDHGRDRDRDYKGRDRRRRRHGDEEDGSRSKKGGAQIAPPVSLAAPGSNGQDDGSEKEGNRPLSNFSIFDKPNVGFDSPVASNIMAKYGWKDGRGLGKQEQGINQCLQVEKTSKRGGKIINQEKDVSQPQENESLAGVMRNPSKVVLLCNMVGPGEVDEYLEPETAEECTKYGEVNKVVIYEIPVGVSEDEAVRIFVEFKKMDSAIKAVIDLNGRFFGGRTVKATFYNLDKFRRLDLTDELVLK